MTNKTMRSISFYRTDIGKIGIVDSNNSITNVYFHGESFSEDAILHETGPLKEANRQLQSYLAGKQKVEILKAIGEGDYRLTLGANEEIQLASLLAHLCSL